MNGDQLQVPLLIRGADMHPLVMCMVALYPMRRFLRGIDHERHGIDACNLCAIKTYAEFFDDFIERRKHPIDLLDMFPLEVNERLEDVFMELVWCCMGNNNTSYIFPFRFQEWKLEYFSDCHHANILKLPCKFWLDMPKSDLPHVIASYSKKNRIIHKSCTRCGINSDLLERKYVSTPPQCLVVNFSSLNEQKYTYPLEVNLEPCLIKEGPHTYKMKAVLVKLGQRFMGFVSDDASDIWYTITEDDRVQGAEEEDFRTMQPLLVFYLQEDQDYKEVANKEAVTEGVLRLG